MRQGGCFHPSLAFSGFMDDFRVYSIDVSSIDLKTDANCTLRKPTFTLENNFKYLKAYLTFDEVLYYIILYYVILLYIYTVICGDKLGPAGAYDSETHDALYAGSTGLLRWHNAPQLCCIPSESVVSLA
jgi:hypothetical protein